MKISLLNASLLLKCSVQIIMFPQDLSLPWIVMIVWSNKKNGVQVYRMNSDVGVFSPCL